MWRRGVAGDSVSHVTDLDAIDFAIAAWREDGAWQADGLPTRLAGSLASLVAALGAHASEAGVVGLVSIGDDTFLIVRVHGGRARLLLSDQTAALEWDLADEVLDALGLEAPEDDDEGSDPAGDMGLLADLGMSADELALLCEDLDLYPDEVLESVAKRLGFAELFAGIVFDRE